MPLSPIRTCWAIALLTCLSPSLAMAAVFEVTTEDDSGFGSLREAIIQANSLNGPDTITFAESVARIQPLSALPALNDTSGGTTILSDRSVVLDGSLLPDNPEFNGLSLNSDNHTVHGLVVVNFEGIGIHIARANNVFSIAGNVVTGCWVGTDGSQSDLGNSTGIAVVDGVTQNRIGGPNPEERNVISGNEFNGVWLSNSTGTIVEGNYIGTNVNGTLPLGNGRRGVFISSGSSNPIGGNVVLGNVISGNGRNGIKLSNTADTIVQSNIIGLAADGATPLGNAEYGIVVTSGATGAGIGGAPDGKGNTISANALGGILLDDATGVFMVGNRIGTATDGYTPAGTQAFGIVLTDANNCLIGDAPNAQGNVIAYHTEHGIVGSSSDVTGISVNANSIHSNGLEGISWTDGANASADTPNFTRTNPIRGSTGLGHTVELFMDNDAEGRILIDTVVADASNGVFESLVDLARYNQLELTATATAPDGSTSEFSDIAVNDLLPTYHTADQSNDGSIELGELLRVIQLFNVGQFSCDETSEDGFATGAGDQNCVPHHSDYAEQDWIVSLSELLRLIQFFNIGAYVNCPERIPVTEDLFCPV